MKHGERLFYRVSEVAELLGMSRAQAYVLVAKGELPSIRIRSMIRVPADALDAMVEKANGSGQTGERP